MNDILKTLLIVGTIIVMGYLIISRSNTNDDYKNIKIQNKILQDQVDVIENYCDSLLFTIDSIQSNKLYVDSLLKGLEQQRNYYKQKYYENRKRIRSNPDSTTNFVKQYLSGYPEKEY